MPSIFTRIINGEIPAHIIAEDEHYLAILDILPLVEGHTLVIPKKEVDYIFHLDDQTLSGLMLFSKKVAAALEKTISCQRIGVAVVGLEVPHTHVHLIPLQTMDDINFLRPRLKFTNEEMANTVAAIKAHLA